MTKRLLAHHLPLQMRPNWLAEHPQLYQQVVALWEQPQRQARAALQSASAMRARSESSLLARLLLSVVDADAAELPRLLDLFAMFDHPVRPCLLPCIAYL